MAIDRTAILTVACLLSGLSLYAVYLMGRGWFPPAATRALDWIGHAAFICLGVGGLQLLIQIRQADGLERLRGVLAALATLAVLGLLARRVFRPPPPPGRSRGSPPPPGPP